MSLSEIYFLDDVAHAHSSEQLLDQITVRIMYFEEQNLMLDRIHISCKVGLPCWWIRAWHQVFTLADLVYASKIMKVLFRFEEYHVKQQWSVL